MDKRTETLSCRVTTELAVAARSLAALDQKSLSDLMCSLLEAYVHDKHSAYLSLSQVFDGTPDIPDVRGYIGKRRKAG